MFDLTPLTDPGLLFLRIMAGAIFADCGYNHVKDPDARSQSLGWPNSPAERESFWACFSSWPQLD
jgi:hypothetical protein